MGVRKRNKSEVLKQSKKDIALQSLTIALPLLEK
jgi:hypothetical protein